VNSEISVSVDVTNSGNLPGDEVVQLYIKHPASPYPVPIHALQGFRRIHLNAGEKATVTFTLNSKQLCIIDNNNQRAVLPGKLQLFIGGQQPDAENIASGSILVKEIVLEGEAHVIDKLD
jgi:beta-glucosidase